MENLDQFVKQGLSCTELACYYKVSLNTIRSYRQKLGLPNTTLIRKLNNDINFKDYFCNLYVNNNITDIINILQKHPLFLRTKLCSRRVGEIRKLYDLPPKMFENIYESEYDRIRGYMIRNSKFMSKRRNLEFNLIYTDFELPKYCPLLGIELTYRQQSNGQHFSHASLDRIDNNKGYIKGNVIVISRLANAMKNSANFEQLDTFSKNILKLINTYKTQGTLGNITDVFPDIELYHEV